MNTKLFVILIGLGTTATSSPTAKRVLPFPDEKPLFPFKLHTPSLDTRSVPGSCSLCNTLIKGVDVIIKDERDERAVSKVLEETCETFHNILVAPCKLLIQSISEKIVNDVDLDHVCSDLGFCSSWWTTRNVKDTVNCTACEFTVKSLQTTAAKRQTRGFDPSVLQPICNHLPGPAGAICSGVTHWIGRDRSRRSNFVARNARDVCAGFDPKLCSIAERTKESLPLCNACEMLMSMLEEIISRQKTMEGIKEEVKQSCSRMPGYTAEMCDDIVNGYEPLLAKFVAKEIGKNEACKELKICSFENK